MTVDPVFGLKKSIVQPQFSQKKKQSIQYITDYELIDQTFY